MALKGKKLLVSLAFAVVLAIVLFVFVTFVPKFLEPKKFCDPCNCPESTGFPLAFDVLPPACGERVFSSANFGLDIVFWFGVSLIIVAVAKKVLKK